MGAVSGSCAKAGCRPQHLDSVLTNLGFVWCNMVQHGATWYVYRYMSMVLFADIVFFYVCFFAVCLLPLLLHDYGHVLPGMSHTWVANRFRRFRGSKLQWRQCGEIRRHCAWALDSSFCFSCEFSPTSGEGKNLKKASGPWVWKR